MACYNHRTNAKLINIYLPISVTGKKLAFARTLLAQVSKIGQVYFQVNTISMEALWIQL